jgi:uncharacterized membrane protein
MLRPPSSTTERLEAFSDGVIAIAITLLVLEIGVPHVDAHDSLWNALVDRWPSYVAFILSFVTIGIMWVSHHSMFERIGAVDRRLLFINLLLLMGIAFLPFPTELVASYVREGGTNSHVAAAVYSLTLVAIGIAFSGMWYHLMKRPWLLATGVPTERTHIAFKRSMIGPGLYLLTVGLAFVSAPACFVAYALISLYFAAGPSSRVVTPADPNELERGSP